MPVAAWFIHSGIYASGGLVYVEWNICQWRIGLYVVEYVSGGLVYTQWNIACGGLVYTQWNICQCRIGLYAVEYMPVVA